MTGNAGERRIRFAVDGHTLRVHDRIESEQIRLEADREPDPQPAITDLFPLPVDRAVSFEAESLSVPAYSAVTVRDIEGEFLATLTEDLALDRGSYCLDVTGPTKVLIRAPEVEIEATGMAGDGPVEFVFDGPTRVTVGGRSLHTKPEATITVPDDPEALMEAVSALGSSIAEWSVERSWPTLRGYPPRIERGAELAVPDHLTTPETGVEISVPATFADVYRVTPLAYYLGATVVPGSEPALRLDTGYVEPLPADGAALEDRISELLRVTLFLDSLARTEGYTPSDRYEYAAVGPELPFYPPNLADRSMSERLMEYLEVDTTTVEPYLPAWPTEAVLRPGPAGMGLLGHLAHVLAPIRVRGSARSKPDETEPGSSSTDRHRPLAVATSPYLPVDDVVSPDSEPLTANTAALTVDAYDNYISRVRPAEGELHVAFAVNSAERAEAIRRAMSDPAPPDGVRSLEIHDRPTAEELAAVVADPDVDLLYCGLPTDEDRVACPSGVVDLGDPEWEPIAAVCEGSMTAAPAASAVESGAIGGLAVDGTLGSDRIRTLLGLLASGTPLAASVALARLPSVADVRLAGDPGATVVRCNQGHAQHIIHARSISGDTHRIVGSSICSTQNRVGSESRWLFDEVSGKHELLGVERMLIAKTATEWVLEAISLSHLIVDFNGAIILQSDQFTEADIERHARRAIEARSAAADSSETPETFGFLQSSEE